MIIKPCTVKAAMRFNFEVHRRLKKIAGGMWAIRIERDLTDSGVTGVAIVGRPVAKVLPQDGTCLQVLRVAVEEGTKNGCSMLYGACGRIAKEMGADDLFTYIHDDESGVSLRASGWIEDPWFKSVGGSWSRPSRPREETVEPGAKKRFFVAWSKYLRR